MQFSCAFQPIIHASRRKVFSYEALVRGPEGQSAGSVFSQVRSDDLLAFDQAAREKALELAAGLGIKCALNLNFLPRSIAASDRYVQQTVDTAIRHGFSPTQIYLEITEQEAIVERESFVALANTYHGLGLKIAIDDFGAGYSGLNLLAEFPPDLVKMDISLIRGIEAHGPRQAIVKAISQVCLDLGIDLLAEGVETPEEYRWLRNHGVELFQGFLLARPGFECLPEATYPAD